VVTHLALFKGPAHHNGLWSRLLSRFQGPLISTDRALIQKNFDALAVKALQPVYSVFLTVRASQLSGNIMVKLQWGRLWAKLYGLAMATQ
jgi:hypothetical protein